MKLPSLSGRISTRGVLVLLITALVVTGGCVGIIGEGNDDADPSAETPSDDGTPEPTNEDQVSTTDSTESESQELSEGTGADESESTMATDESGTDEQTGTDSDTEAGGASTTAGSESTAEPQLDYVPASADAIVTIDPSILTHETTVTLADHSESTNAWNYSDLNPASHSLFELTTYPANVTSYGETIDLYEEQLGIAVEDVHSVTFVTEEGDRSDESTSRNDRESKHHEGVAILDTELRWETMQEALAQSDRIEGEFTEHSYEGVTLYDVPKNDSAYDKHHAADVWVADFEDGVFAVGPEADVKAVVDTAQGTSPAVNGSLREEAAAADGLVTAVADLSQDPDRTGEEDPTMDLLGSLDTLVVEYAPDGETIHLNQDIVATDHDSAREVQSVLSFLLASYQQSDDQEKREAVDKLVGATTVTVDENRAQVRFEMSASRLASLLEQLEQSE